MPNNDIHHFKSLPNRVETTKVMEIPGYTIIRELGKGGMATVYLAIQDRLDRQVALKVLNPALAVDDNFTERFIKEGRIIDQLRHPFIIPLFEFNFYKHHYYFSMEFLPGGTLSQQIQQGLTPKRVLTITKRIAEALAYAHQRNVIHRDIKPQNVLFRQDGTPVLSDFGIAKVMDTDATNLTALGSIIGSLHYMSPEQATSKPLDARSDLYSLGVVFYEMLTKKTPYQANDIFRFSQILGTGPIPALPEELVSLQPIMNKLLAIDPGHRFESAERLIQAIDQINSHPSWQLSRDNTVQRILPENPEPETQIAKPDRAKPALAIGGLILATLAIAVVAGIYLAIFHHPPRPDSDIDAESAQPSHDTAQQPPRQARQQVEQLLAQARSRQQQGGLDESLDLIEQGLRLVPEQPDLLALRDQVKTEIDRRNRIAGLLRDCAARFPLNRLADDQGEATVACYDQILKLDSTNSEARVNLERIANHFADRTSAALLQGDLDKAEDYLARLSRLAPDHPRLSALNQNVRAKREQATAEAARRQAQEVARRQAVVEELRRKTEREAKRKPSEPSRPQTASMEAKRKPATTSTGINRHRRCGDILSRITLGEPVSNEDRTFLTKECR
ncbi:MAG: protein kinase [Candidatus Contendobacter sp.]|nr:protein kinase [Candidatus Contendobacter sp.]MDS4058670.1 protein kinase [Candidatus Contendobacter sp.]